MLLFKPAHNPLHVCSLDPLYTTFFIVLLLFTVSLLLCHCTTLYMFSCVLSYWQINEDSDSDVRCSLGPSDEYHWTVHVQGAMRPVVHYSISFDYLLLLLIVLRTKRYYYWEDDRIKCKYSVVCQMKALLLRRWWQDQVSILLYSCIPKNCRTIGTGPTTFQPLSQQDNSCRLRIVSYDMIQYDTTRCSIFTCAQ